MIKNEGFQSSKLSARPLDQFETQRAAEQEWRERERRGVRVRERELIFVRAISTNHPDVNYKIGRRGGNQRLRESVHPITHAHAHIHPCTHSNSEGESVCVSVSKRY